jgi:hypothetical protein
MPPASETLPPELHAALERELDEGESLLWHARPIPDLYTRRFRSAQLFAILPLLLGGGMVVVLIRDAPGFFRNLSLLRAAERHVDIGISLAGAGVGVAMGLGALLAAAWLLHHPARARRQALRTAYAITPARAIILTLDARGNIEERDYRADELVHLLRRERADGTGDVLFESARRPKNNELAPPHGFVAIRDAAAVERLLRGQFGTGSTVPS